jgi:hypothetical protein
MDVKLVGMGDDVRRNRRLLGYALAWLVAAGLAITVGLLAVTTVGASIRGRGPLGNEAIRTAELNDDGRIDPDAPVRRASIDEDYGSFVVQCQGTIASGIDTATIDGWRVVSFETGPDDDVDAIFVNGKRSIEVEVFCNRGEPTVAELERKTLPEAAG